MEAGEPGGRAEGGLHARLMRTRGLEVVKDGIAVLGETLSGRGMHRHSMPSLHTRCFSTRTPWPRPGGQPVFPVIRNPNWRGELTIAERRQVMFDDNTTPTLAYLWSARRKKGPDVQYNHVFGDPRNPATYTVLWNLCVTPAFLAKTTDGSNHPEVLAALRYRVLELYGCWPEREERPIEPPGYRALTWREPPPAIADLEAELRARLEQAPASPPAQAARRIGWLFSEWKPDESLGGVVG